MGILLKDVCYRYQGKYQTVQAVNGISYDFESGKLYAIVGKSGSGKTTLLSLMAGLDLPTSGDILINGVSTRDWNRSKMRREAVSVIYQNYNLFPLLTVEENIQYPLTLKKMPSKEALALAHEMRERVELPAAYDKRLPNHLSGGEQQRVAIARTLAQGSKILLADEPTGNLDSRSSRAVIDAFLQAKADLEATIFMVTHDSFAASFCDRVVILRDGVVWRTLEKGATDRTAFQDQLLDAIRDMGKE